VSNILATASDHMAPASKTLALDICLCTCDPLALVRHYDGTVASLPCSYERDSRGLPQVTVLSRHGAAHKLPLASAMCSVQPGANATYTATKVWSAG
jgi:hypothetical protein